jgi:hypothetical protein
MRLPRDSEIASARRLVVIVGLGYLIAQLVVFSLDRPPSWDEAIYLSQVTPGAEPLPFVPSRARGITFLALPVLQLGGSLPLLRLFLAVASAAALVASFRTWASVIGFGAAAGAILFAGSWPALLYGTELMPNLWVALIAVAATAVLARRFARGERRTDELVAGGLVAIAALIRPLDAVVLTAALVLVPIVVRRAKIAWTIHLLLGLLAGWAPWLVEMTARSGSPGTAFAAAARLGHTGTWSLFGNARQYLALSDGPSIGPVTDPEIPVSGVLWFLGLGALVVLGIRASAGRGLLPALLVPTTAGVALAAEYVAFIDAQAPRFLLPSLALLAVPAGLGVISAVAWIRAPQRAGPTRLLAAAAASVLVIAWAVVHAGIAARVEAAVSVQRAAAERAGMEVRRLARGDRCFVHSEANFPVVGLSAGCRAAPLGTMLGTWGDRADRLAREGTRPFLLLQRTEEPVRVDGAALVASLPSTGELVWFIYAPG